MKISHKVANVIGQNMVAVARLRSSLTVWVTQAVTGRSGRGGWRTQSRCTVHCVLVNYLSFYTKLDIHNPDV